MPGSALGSGSPGFQSIHRWNDWVRGPLLCCCKSLHFRVDRRLLPRLALAAWPRSGCSIHRDPLQHGQPAPAAADPLAATAAQGGSAPPAGGDCASSASGDTPTKCATFFRGAGGEWAPGLQRLRWIPLLLGWCLVRLRPTAPLNSPPRRRGIPSPLRSVGIHEEKEGMCVLGGWRAAVRPGIRGGPWIDGCYGSTREIIRSITKRACGGVAFGG